MRTKRFVIAGVVMIVAAMLCNLNWAMNDYGIKEISLDSRILAQSTTTNSGNNKPGGGTGSDAPKGVGIERHPCTISGKVEANMTIKVCFIPFKADAEGNITITVGDAEILCLVEGKYSRCDQMYCSDFWAREGVRLDGGGTSTGGGNSNGGTTIAN